MLNTYTWLLFFVLVSPAVAGQGQAVSSPTLMPPESKTSRFRLDIFAGVARNDLYDLFPAPLGPARMGSSFAPQGGMGVRYVFPCHRQALALGFSLGYSPIKSTATATGVLYDSLAGGWNSVTNYTEHLSLSNALLFSNLYAEYSFIRRGPVVFYGKAGVNFNFLLQSGGDVYSTYTGMTTLYHVTVSPVPGAPPQGTKDVLKLGTNAVCGLTVCYFFTLVD